jgi:hypothetical protein
MIAKLNLYVSLIMTLIYLDPCQWSLMSLITGNKVKKNKHASQGIVKRKGQSQQKNLEKFKL